MTKIKSYHDLRIWKLGIAIVKETYSLTRKFPKTEIYGLSSQLQRAAVSIPSNIAEGQVRAGTKEFVQFLRISLSSCAEVETQMIIAKELGYLTSSEYDEFKGLMDDEAKQIRALLKQLTNH